ncbi:hypothetical protein HPB47_017147 [Ixodes persulcatus]|uniref:Uncharacterized protein n=1 Tax=Ixodes persulcatus TaxID=34615 RepID=A0AC60QRH9_IXOPE|nr:hypothetical protein HPB47_017147 [Ixodes persulcatus]
MADETKELKMTATIGKPLEFRADSGNFEIYLERLELLVAANNIAEEKKLQVFLTAIGENADIVLRSLLLPKTPNRVSYQEAVSILQKHYTYLDAHWSQNDSVSINETKGITRP